MADKELFKPVLFESRKEYKESILSYVLVLQSKHELCELFTPYIEDTSLVGQKSEFIVKIFSQIISDVPNETDNVT